MRPNEGRGERCVVVSADGLAQLEAGVSTIEVERKRDAVVEQQPKVLTFVRHSNAVKEGFKVGTVAHG